MSSPSNFIVHVNALTEKQTSQRTGWTTLGFNHAKISNYLLARHLLSFLVLLSLFNVHNEQKAAKHKHGMYLSNISAICRKSSCSGCGSCFCFFPVFLFSPIRRLCHAFIWWKTLQGSPPIKDFHPFSLVDEANAVKILETIAQLN